ncbi:hypothetical protein [Paenibacillus glycanilyticus]|uniref:hypothetical protein n=1 Tax=Paenibacillus glycanilyticus TaxID=126569 RepID=UPI001FCF9186|nr:hypothetical protein [Paenibacillus glycanilyticus]
MYGSRKSVKVQYDTPYIRHLPTKLYIQETEGEAFRETVLRPTYTDPYTLELIYMHDVIVSGGILKTTPEDAREDLVLFRMIMEALQR